MSGSGTVAAFSPDGARLVTAGSDRLARVWEAATGRQLAELRGRTEGVVSVAFSPDGRWLLTASDTDGTVRLWRADTGAQITLMDVDGVLHEVGFSADGRRVVAANVSRATLAAFACEVCGSSEELIALARSRVTRALTCEERTRYLHDTRQCPSAPIPSSGSAPALP
jgi:hypothetical protein